MSRSNALSRDLTGGLPCLVVVLMAVLVVLLACAGVVRASVTVTVKRCGYVNAGHGRNAIYPWALSCASARAVVLGADDPHNRAIHFTAPASDGGAVRINGHWWVCTGQMGYYNCGFPYRPERVHGGTAYNGPFTKDVVYEACALVDPDGSGCPVSAQLTQPPG